MINPPAGTRIWIVAGITDMRNGFNGLASKVQMTLKDDPMSGHVFIFRGRNGSQVKLLWSTGDGLCLLTKRLERGRFAWPSARDGKVFLTPAQLAMLLEGIDWRSAHIDECIVPHVGTGAASLGGATIPLAVSASRSAR
jgi:transposase